MNPFLLAMLTQAFDPPKKKPGWSPLNVALATASTGAIGTDLLTTHAGLNRGARELNPLLGPHPSEGRLNTLVTLGALTNLGVGAILPPKARNWWFGAVTALELAAALRNSTIKGRKARRTSIPLARFTW